MRLRKPATRVMAVKRDWQPSTSTASSQNYELYMPDDYVNTAPGSSVFVFHVLHLLSEDGAVQPGSLLQH